MGIEHKWPFWMALQSETIARAKPPYTGVNLFTVKTENLEAVLASLKLQTEYIKKIGGNMIGLSRRDYGDRHDIIWCFHYPAETTDWGQPEMMEESIRFSVVEWPKWYSMMERHDWYLLESEAIPFPDSVDAMHRQIPPPSDEALATTKAMLQQAGYTAVEASD